MMEENYLAHHGIKGQKWGVRRYQNEDGTYTPEGKSRYVGENDSKKQESTKDVEARKAKVRKIIGIAAGVAIVAVVAHKVSKGLTKYGTKFRQDLDKGIDPIRAFRKDLSQERNKAYMIPKGGKVQRLSRYNEEYANGHAYVTVQPDDNERYRGFFGKILQRSAAATKVTGIKNGATPYVYDLTAKENLISPDKETRISTFLSMYRDDPVSIGKTLGKYHKKEFHDRGILPAFVYKKQYQHLTGSEKVTKGYKTFVKAIGDNKNAAMRNEYFKRLGQKGYNMVQDDQDSGLVGVRPSIVFDRRKSLEYNGKRELLGSEIKDMYKKYGRRIPKEQRHREWN